jgi:sensor domain CHASE-containing protein
MLLPVFAITAVVVIVLGAWMQNNAYLQARRNKQVTADLRTTIAKENARR